jgi:uncharacterized protein YkwD
MRAEVKFSSPNWLMAALVGAMACTSACQPLPTVAASSAGPTYVSEAGPVPRPTGPLSAEDATRYVLALVNHDRSEVGAPPVEWDDTAARAGQDHVNDMAANGYTAHWGTDGSVPEARYTRVGGAQLMKENVACFFDGQHRDVDGGARFDPIDLEKIETAFMSEVPPNDGHKKNILGKWHNKVGIALAMPVGVPQPCMAQEFVDQYGEYASVPATAKVGETVTVAGEVQGPAKFAGVGIARIEPVRPLTVAHLNSTSTYAIPKPFVLYFPRGYQTPKPVTVDGNRFTIDVPLTDHEQPGRYEISVWGAFPDDPALVMLSLRTIDVR